MKTALSALERKILGVIQSGMPMSLSPYRELSATLGMPVDQLLEVLRCWKAEKKIRRLGAIVNHFQMGHGVGAMVVWNVPESRINDVGTLFASFSAVSHAYQRPSGDRWPYSVYTMVHASSEDELRSTIEAMRDKSGIREFRALKTVQELKKVPPTYIIEH